MAGHIDELKDFIFYPKPLYKSLPQSFFYSFITILPSESGVTLDYSMILSYTLSFRQLSADPELEQQICCFPYGEHSDVPRLQQVEQKVVGRQRNF
jgi:hypothetical protein